MRRATLSLVIREWARIGITSFGGPPAQIALLRELCVERRRWMDAREFEDANAATQLLPGPGGTQLAIYCASRAGGRAGAVAGGLAFILPGLLVVLAISAVALGDSPPAWIQGVGAGAAATVAVGPYVVLVLVGCGALELGRRRVVGVHAWPVLLAATATLPALAWTALKVGALSYGGGFVIIPLMQGDAVDEHGWMTSVEFANAVAYGQLTPGPVVHTVAIVGWAAAGLGGALLAAAVAFVPSFAVVLALGSRFGLLRSSATARAFLDGAGPAAVGAVLGAVVPLFGALEEAWQYVVLGAACVVLALGRATLWVLGGGAVVGLVVGVAGGPLPG